MYKYIVIVFLFLSSETYAQHIVHKADTTCCTDLKDVKVTTDIFSDRNIKGKRADGQARTERLLENIQGVSLISRGNFAQEAVIRGMSDGQISVTIDGMRVFSACADRMDPASSYIEPNNLQSIQVSYGPGMNVYGSNVGGGINFTLKDPQYAHHSTWKGNVGAGFETNALAKQMLGSLSYGSTRFALNVNGIFRDAANYIPGGSKKFLTDNYGIWSRENGFSVDKNGRLNFSQYRKWNIGANAKWKINDKQDFKVDYLQDNASNIGYPALTMDVAFANAAMGAFTHMYNSETGKIQSVTTKLYYNFINHAMDDTKRPKEQVAMHMDMPGHNTTYGTYSEALIKISNNNTLKTRLEYFNTKWHAEMTMYNIQDNTPMYMLTIPDANAGVLALDAEENIALQHKWRINYGGRLEYRTDAIYSDAGKAQLSSVYSGNLTARNKLLYNAHARINYFPVNKITLYAKVASAVRAATSKELYSVFLFNRVDGFDYVGNPDLKNESVLNLSVGGSYKVNKLKIEMNLFYNLFQNYIAGLIDKNYSPMTPGAYGIKQYQNIQTAYTAGAELSVDYKISDKFDFFSVNSYLNGKDNNHHFLPLIPPFKTFNTLRFQISESMNAFAELAASAAQNNVSNFYGETKTPAYQIINAGIQKKFTVGKNSIQSSITAQNILNKYYYEHLDVIKIPRQGRNFIFHLTYFF